MQKILVLSAVLPLWAGQPEAQQPGTITLELVSRESVIELAKQVRDLTGRGHILDMREEGKRYPFHGMGFSYRATAREERAESGSVRYGVRIVAVFKDSPASAAGVRAADWLVSVNGQNITDGFVKEGDDSDAALKQLLDQVTELTQQSHEPVLLVLQRDEKWIAVSVGKADIGLAIRGFWDSRTPVWEKSLGMMRPEAEAFLKQAEAAGGSDQSELDGLWEEGVKLHERATAYQREFDEFLFTQFELPPQFVPDNR